MHIVFRADASPRIGGGHVMRCLALADELARGGAQVTFVAATMLPALASRITAAGHELAIVPAVAELTSDRADWDSALLPPGDQRDDAKATLAAINGTGDWIAVDHYRLDRAWEKAARSRGVRVFVIDDLANRAHDADLLLDQTLGRTRVDYAPWIGAGCRLLLGPTFAPLRPEFAAERPAALTRRREIGPIRRVLVSMGSGDLDGVTRLAVAAAREALPDTAIDVVLPHGTASFDAILGMAEADPAILLHPDPPCMAALIRDADIAIGAAGTSSWERCCLGLPTVTLSLAANQRNILARLANANAITVAADTQSIPNALKSLAKDNLARAQMIAAGFAITDGFGVQRVARALGGELQSGSPIFTIRAAAEADSQTVWLWRNDPQTRARSISKDAVRWGDHERWFVDAIGSSGRRQYLVANGEQDTALVRFDDRPNSTEVSINVAPAMRGRGVGERALALAIAADRERTGHLNGLTATIHCDHIASKKIFESLGFRPTSVLVASGFVSYELAHPDIVIPFGKV